MEFCSVATHPFKQKHIHIHTISLISVRQILLQENSISAKKIKSSEGISVHQVRHPAEKSPIPLGTSEITRIATRILIIRYMQHPIYIANPEGIFVTSTRTIKGVESAA